MPCMPSVSCRLGTMDDDDGRWGSDLTRLGSRRPVGIGKTAAAQRHLFCPALRGSEPRDSHLGVANTTHGARAGCIVRRAGWFSQLQAIFAAAKQPLVRCQGCSGGAHRRTHCSHSLFDGWLVDRNCPFTDHSSSQPPATPPRQGSFPDSRKPLSIIADRPPARQLRAMETRRERPNARPPRDDLCLFGPPRPWPAASGRRSLQACCFSVCLSVSLHTRYVERRRAARTHPASHEGGRDETMVPWANCPFGRSRRPSRIA
jgi:hypothetical protein